IQGDAQAPDPKANDAAANGVVDPVRFDLADLVAGDHAQCHEQDSDGPKGAHRIRLGRRRFQRGGVRLLSLGLGVQSMCQRPRWLRLLPKASKAAAVALALLNSELNWAFIS